MRLYRVGESIGVNVGAYGGHATLLSNAPTIYCVKMWCKQVSRGQEQMPTARLTPELIAAAIEGYEAQKSRIDGTIAELRAMLSGGRTEAGAAPATPKRKRRKLSAAARERIAEAQRKRWAEAKKSTEPEPQEAAKPKRKLSAAGRKRIIAATKKRWAAVKAAKQAEKPAVAKKTATKKTPVAAAKKTAAKRSQKAAAATAPSVAQAAE